MPQAKRKGGVAIPREIELKLEIDPADLDRLLKHPVLGAGRGWERRTLSSTYFDTPDHDLRRAGISLRIRNDGHRSIQTLKARGSSDGIALDRDEWECDVAGDRPDFSQLGAAPVPAPDLERIGPLFSVNVERSLLVRRHCGSTVEIAVDRGRIRGADAAEMFAEIELELKDGNAADLFDLACTLAEAAPLRLSFSTKSDRGFGRMAGRAVKRVKADPVTLKRRMSSAEAFRAIAASCLRHLMANEPLVRERREPEAVHQMRVALRRLRAAITLFKAVVSDDRRDAIKTELKWMADQLGEARDLDVFIAKTLEPARERHEGDADFELLLREYKARRREAYDRVEAAITSPRFLRGILETAAWVEAGDWTARNGTDRPAVEQAGDELARRWKTIRKRGKGLTELAPEERHQVRIEIKKLRYATEFFGSLFKGPRTKKRRQEALQVLESLQETLGELNDIAVAAEGEHSSAADILRQEQSSRVDELLASAREQYETFSSLKPFWKAGRK